MEGNLSNVSFRIDSTVKAKAEALFAELGLNMTTAFNMFLRQSIREGRIPFSAAIIVNGNGNSADWPTPAKINALLGVKAAAINAPQSERVSPFDLIGVLDDDYDPRPPERARTFE
jgi:addiction module RelB/DinJ family antitoxin